MFILKLTFKGKDDMSLQYFKIDIIKIFKLLILFHFMFKLCWLLSKFILIFVQPLNLPIKLYSAKDLVILMKLISINSKDFIIVHLQSG